MKTTSILTLLEATHLAIFNTTEHDEIQKQMSAYGFTPKRMQEGKVKMEYVRLLDDTQTQHYDRVREMMLQIEQDSDTMLDVFRGHVSIAKSAFRKEKHVLKALKINKISSSKWTGAQQAIYFYGKAPIYMERLQQFGATEESFAQNKAAAEALLALKAQRLKKKGDAEHSTLARDQAVKELRTWYGEFRKLARLAFSETPQKLETFGIVVRTTRRKRKAATDSTTASDAKKQA